MTILHLSAVKNWGGGGNQIENLCSELSKTNPEVKNIIVVAENGSFHDRLKKSNFNFNTLPMSFNVNPCAIYKIIRLCKKEKVDLIHIHGSASLTLAVIADHFSDLPPFILSKKTSFAIKSRKQTLYKYNYPKIKRILCVSKVTQAITEKSIKNPEKVVCIYHGTAIKNKKAENTIDLRKKFQLQKDTLIIGNIANHIRAKNLETFLKVAYEMVHVKQMKNLHFVQIGAFTNRTDDLMKMLKEMDLEAHVSFTGEIHNAAALIPQFNISLMTSQSEGLPQFIYESFYHRVPVISTDVGGISEVIEHEKNGFLTPAHDHKALAESLKQLVDQPDLRKKFTETSRETIEKNFTSELMASKTLEVYKQVIHGRF